MIDFLSLVLSPLLELTKWLIRKVRPPDPRVILERREELRREFQSNLPVKNRYGVHCDAIIRDIKRMDSYPDTEAAEKGISAWFKVEVKGLYHRGIAVFIGHPIYIKRDVKDRWVVTDHEDPDDRKELAYPVGQIPFDQIEYINWQGDEYYECPHIYCRFTAFRGQPYESIPFFAKGAESEHLFEVEGFRPWDKKAGGWLAKLKGAIHGNWD
jgi:hypothetical protein